MFSFVAISQLHTLEIVEHLSQLGTHLAQLGLIQLLVLGRLLSVVRIFGRLCILAPKNRPRSYCSPLSLLSAALFFREVCEGKE